MTLRDILNWILDFNLLNLLWAFMIIVGLVVFFLILSLVLSVPVWIWESMNRNWTVFLDSHPAMKGKLTRTIGHISLFSSLLGKVMLVLLAFTTFLAYVISFLADRFGWL